MGTAGIVIISEQPFASFIDEARDLIYRHAAEVNPHVDIPVKVNEALYIAAAARDMVRVYVARIDGVIVGYAVFIVDTSLNWMQSLQATQTGFYVDPSYRISTIGTRLLRYCTEALTMLGVQLVLQPQFTQHPALAKLLEREGYVAQSVVWTKRLDKGRH